MNARPPQNIVDRIADPEIRKQYGSTREERATKHLVKLEKELRNQVESFLNRYDVYYIISRHDRRPTIRAGHPDISIWHQGKWLLVELKAAAGRLSEDQKLCISHLERSACPVSIITNYPDFIKLWNCTFPS